MTLDIFVLVLLYLPLLLLLLLLLLPLLPLRLIKNTEIEKKGGRFNLFLDFQRRENDQKKLFVFESAL